MKRRVFAAALAALLLTGCGSRGESGSASSQEAPEEPVVIGTLALELPAGGDADAARAFADSLPEAMAAYVRRMDFIIGVQAAAPHDCGVVTWNGTMYINCIRSIREPELEMHFYRVLRKLGLHVKVESNQR